MTFSKHSMQSMVLSSIVYIILCLDWTSQSPSENDCKGTLDLSVFCHLFGNLLFLFPLQVGQDGSLTKTVGMTSQTGPVTCVDWVQGARALSTCITASLDGTIHITGLLKSSINQAWDSEQQLTVCTLDLKLSDDKLVLFVVVVELGKTTFTPECLAWFC